MHLQFTDEMKLIIENWDVVRDIHMAEEALGRQLRDILFSLGTKLAEQPWWDSSWKFERHQDTQVFITNQEWKGDKEPSIWIGVENFNVKSVFGEEGNAGLYLWVPKNNNRLLLDLRSHLQTLPNCSGEIESKANNSYVARQPLRKCLPEELDRFDEIVIEPILEFMSYYAEQRENFTEILASIDKSGGG